MRLSTRFRSTPRVSSFLEVGNPFCRYHFIEESFIDQYSLFCLLGDNGTLSLWDYDTGIAFQNMEDVPQPGSLEAEAGVFCSTFDVTGTRLITGGADKTIKVPRFLDFQSRC